MMLDLKNVKRINAYAGGRLLVFVNVEDFRTALDNHSPNLLIDYLNERYGMDIPQLPVGRKEAEDANI